MDTTYEEMQVKLGDATHSVSDIVDASIAMQAAQMSGFKSVISAGEHYDRLIQGAVKLMLNPDNALRAVEDYPNGLEGREQSIADLTFTERDRMGRREGREVSVAEITDLIRDEVVSAFEICLAEPYLSDMIKDDNLAHGITTEQEAPTVVDMDIMHYMEGQKDAPLAPAEGERKGLLNLDELIQEHFALAESHASEHGFLNR